MITHTKIGDIYINNAQDNEIIREILLEDSYGIEKRNILSGTVLDIGAHIGIFSKLALGRGCKVISVEPEEKNFKLLQVNAPGATYVNAAVVGSKGQRVLLNVHPTRGEMHKLDTTGVEVKSITLDELIWEPINLLKMDIEGGEYSAFYGSSRLHLVNQIVMEYHNGIDKMIELIEYLEAFGLKPIYISGEEFGQLHLRRYD
jgi:FkbM family methyltransferase